jgi:LysM repeat protein
MSFPGDEPDLDAVCEFLGLADDAESHATYATEAHRCYKLANPTRIASQHQENFCLVANHANCPVFLGEGVQRTQTATPVPQRPQPRDPADLEPVAAAPAPPRGGRPNQRPGRQQRPEAGTLGPRPRPGGISMPAATIGLLALAVVVVGLAFLVQNLLGGDDDNPGLSPEDVAATNEALNATRTAQAGGGGGETPSNGGETPGAETPGAETPTPGNGDEPTATPGEGETPGGGNGETYTVQSGDFCSTIAAEFDTTVEDIIAANDLDEDCTIFEGQELVIP